MHLRGGATDGDPARPTLDEPELRTIHARVIARDLSLCGVQVIPLVCHWRDEAIRRRCPTCTELAVRLPAPA